MSKHLYYNISFLRVLALICVVLGHTLMYDSPIMVNMYKIIYSFHIPLFVFISGYLFMDSQSLRQNGFLLVMINKFKRLIVPCFIVSLLWIIPAHIFISKDLGTSFSAIWVKVKDLLSGNVEYLWFLLMLFWTTIIFYPLSIIFRHKYSSVGIPLIGIVLAWIFVNTNISALPNFYSISQVSKYLYYFYLGAIFYTYREKINAFIRKNRIIILFASGLLVLNGQLYILTNFETHVGAWFIVNHIKSYLVVSTITISFLYIFTICFEPIFETWFKRSKTMSFLDKESLVIYYIHTQIGTIVILLINKIKAPLAAFYKISLLFFSMLLLSSAMIAIYRKAKTYLNLMKIT